MLFRSNVRTGFDKYFEDAIGFFYEDILLGSEQNRWHTLITAAEFKMIDMADIYDSLVADKQRYFENLQTYFSRLPN